MKTGRAQESRHSLRSLDIDAAAPRNLEAARQLASVACLLTSSRARKANSEQSENFERLVARFGQTSKVGRHLTHDSRARERRVLAGLNACGIPVVVRRRTLRVSAFASQAAEQRRSAPASRLEGQTFTLPSSERAQVSNIASQVIPDQGQLQPDLKFEMHAGARGVRPPGPGCVLEVVSNSGGWPAQARACRALCLPGSRAGSPGSPGCRAGGQLSQPGAQADT